MRHFGLLAALLFVFNAAGLAMAGPTATLTGRVKDSSYIAIRGVKVNATNVNTNVTSSAETNVAGLYSIPNLAPGTYRIVAWKFAYSIVVKPDVTLHADDVVNFNFTMELGSVQETIMMEAGASLLQSDSQRGGYFSSREVQQLPLVSMDPISLARTLPGVIEPAGSHVYTPQGLTSYYFSVNGQRMRANNFMLDSTENNDIAFTGVAQPFNMADAVEEVVVQTADYGAEFGRATGGIFNVVTRSGTNRFHGTSFWRYASQRFDSVSNLDKLSQIPKSVFSHNVFGFTLGGPIVKDRTFFFTGYQQDTLRSTLITPLVVPTEQAVTTLGSLFPSNRQLDLYLNSLGSLRGTAIPSYSVNLGPDSVTGLDRGTVDFATAPFALPESNGGPQWLVRLDHSLSDSHQISLRYIFDFRRNSPRVVYFPGYVADETAQNHNLLFTDQYVFSSGLTNEFRFSYGRQDADTKRISSQSLPMAQTLPRFIIPNIASPGINSLDLQDTLANNLLFQETQTWLSGRHTFNYGVEFLVQRATQRPAANFLGQINYTASTQYSAFANFLDDYSGPIATATQNFGVTVFHPNQFHQTYFFQDRWLPASSLSLTMGIRYENFGQPANALRYPAFAGFNPEDFLKPNHVNTDNNNLGPALGLAWSPSFRSGWLGKLFGENRTVWRGGYQVSYDAFFTELASLQLAGSTPNAVSKSNSAPKDGRGVSEWFENALLDLKGDPNISDPQIGALEKDFRSPYTERWSFGFQREFSNKFVIDGAYVGSESHKLTTWDNANPQQPDGSGVLYPLFGGRGIRTSQGNSSYHAMQWRLDRRFAGGFRATASYTWSKNLDSTSEGVGGASTQGSPANRTSVPLAKGGLKLDHGPSDYDRTHRMSLLYLWNIRGPSRGFLKYAFGGWSMAGIVTFQSGAPYTVLNGFDRITHKPGASGNRPDIGNPNAPLNSRALISLPTDSVVCDTGYRNPDTNACVTPADVHWVQGIDLPNASTVGRNTLRAGGVNNLDLSVSKSFQIGEQKRVEFRWDAFNALNHPQFTQIPVTAERSVVGSTTAGFLNRNFTDAGNRSMWLQLKLSF